MSAANLRSRLADHPEAEDVHAIVDELTAASAEFAALWARYDVRRRRSDIKAFRRPACGDISFVYDSLQLENPTLRLTIYQPASQQDEQALRLLSMSTDLTLS